MNEISIGKIVKPQGILGEVKILSYLDDTKVFCMLKEIRVAKQNEYVKIEKIRTQNGFAFAKLENVNSREDAEKLKYQEVFADKEQIRNLLGDMQSVFYEDLIGMTVQGKNVYGKVAEIEELVANDVMSIKNGKNELLVPVIDGLIEKIDEQNKTVFVNDKIFNEVVVKQDED